MKYRVQSGKPTLTELTPDGWADVEAADMRAAAVAHLQAGKQTLADYPIMVYVSDGKLLHPNGTPMCVHGYLFQLDIEEMPAPTADDIKHELKDARYADGRNAWDSAEAMTADVSAELRRRGIPHAPAQYDAGGNCLTCGECGRCPGVHTFEEIQRADRAQKGIAT